MLLVVPLLTAGCQDGAPQRAAVLEQSESARPALTTPPVSPPLVSFDDLAFDWAMVLPPGRKRLEPPLEIRTMRWKLRFSLRTFLLIPTVAAAILCYALMPWWTAQRFVSAVRRGQAGTAREMLGDAVPSYSHSAAIEGAYDLYVAP